jgi:hypothetical protein
VALYYKEVYQKARCIRWTGHEGVATKRASAQPSRYLLDVAAGPDPGGVLIETWGRTHVVIPIGTEPVVPGRYGRGDSRAVRLRYRFSC